MAAVATGIAPGTRVKMGPSELEFGRTIEELRDSNDLLGDRDALRQRLQDDGYLLLRGLQDRAAVLRGRMDILRFAAEKQMLDPAAPLEEGRVAPEKRGAMVPQDVVHRMANFMGVVNSPAIMGFFARFLAGDVVTFDYKWLRIVPTGGFTGAHYDIVYMGRGTKSLYTCWTPFDDVTLEKGPICLCLGSQHFEKIKQTYGQMDVDRDKVRGWFSSDPLEVNAKFGGRWATTEFRAGDVLIFGMYLMHGSLINATPYYRISSDTRYQLASEPTDERWVGKQPIGHYAWHQGEGVDMAAARARWGV